MKLFGRELTIDETIGFVNTAIKEHRYSDDDQLIVDAAETIAKHLLVEQVAKPVWIEHLIPKPPVFKTGESRMCVDYADGHGEIKVNKWADWTCPECGWFVGEQYVPRRHNQQKCKFCSRCGQAIDWNSAENPVANH